MNALQKAGLLQLLPTMPYIDSMQCMVAFNKAYDTHLDWHPIADYLAQLESEGILRIVQPGGFVHYALVTGETK